MIYLTGARNAAVEPLIADGSVGLLNTPRSGYRIDESVAVWAMDNGCFTGSYPGDEAYLARLEKLATHASRCLFATAPDVLGDAEATIAASLPMLARIRELGYPVALVAQDGMESLPLPWDEFDWLFIGGSTDWKLGEGCMKLIATAKARGKRIHVGRVNSKRRFLRFAEIGCDTADGTFLAFAPDTNLVRLLDWLRASEHRQAVMMYGEASIA